MKSAHHSSVCTCSSEHASIDRLAQRFIQQKFTYSKSTIETLEKGVKYIQHHSGVFIVNFGHI